MKTKVIVSKVTPWLSLGILLFVGIVSLLLLRAKPQILRSTDRITEIRQDSVQHWRDEFNHEHGQRLIAEGKIEVLEQVYGPMVDSVFRSVGTNGRKLDNLTALGTTTAGAVRPHVDQVIIHDKPVPHFAYNDRWLKLDGYLADTPLIRYSTFDSLIVTTYRKRKWLLGKQRTYIDAYSVNPASHISGLTGLKVAEDRPKRFGIGPFVGYGFNGQRWEPSLGFSLHYSLIRF